MGQEVELPKPILIEDLGLIYETKQSKGRRRWGKYKCGFCGTEFNARTQHIKSNLTKSHNLQSGKRQDCLYHCGQKFQIQIQRIKKPFGDQVRFRKCERRICFGI